MRRAPRRQPALGDLVQQGLVADLQDARGFSTVPLNALEDFRQRLAFRLLGPGAMSLKLSALGDVAEEGDQPICWRRVTR